MIEPTEEEQKKILEEIADHSAYWGSDRCKRNTVEKHLGTVVRECHPGRETIKNIAEKIDWMIQQDKITFIPGRTGGYLQWQKK